MFQGLASAGCPSGTVAMVKQKCFPQQPIFLLALLLDGNGHSASWAQIFKAAQVF
jgi:hypothetical protein